MKNKDFARLFVSGKTTPNGKQKQSVNIVSMMLDGGQNDSDGKPLGVLCASYYYHSSLIASLEGDRLAIQWCGFYTLSTARHINYVLDAVGYHKQRVSYANDRDRGIASRVYIKENNQWKLSEVVNQDGTGVSICDGMGE